MEAYGNCGGPVITFLSAWDSQLHADGYVAGVYESFSNISDLINAAGKMTEPDVIHYADWDGKAVTTSSYMPANRWTNHQRLHQYRGGHNESWGGASMNVDDDQLDVNLSGLPVSSGPARRRRRRSPAARRRRLTAGRRRRRLRGRRHRPPRPTRSRSRPSSGSRSA